MFDVEEFVASCQGALKEHTPELAVKELLSEAIARPGEIEAALGTPEDGGITTLLRSDELTIVNVIWPPGMAIYPHDHQLWRSSVSTVARRTTPSSAATPAAMASSGPASASCRPRTPSTSAATPSTPSTTPGRCTPEPFTSTAATSSPSPVASGPTSPHPRPPTASRAPCAPSPMPTSAGSPRSSRPAPLTTKQAANNLAACSLCDRYGAPLYIL